MRNRWRAGAPILAQGLSFAVVLFIGVAFGHGGHGSHGGHGTARRPSVPHGVALRVQAMVVSPARPATGHGRRHTGSSIPGTVNPAGAPDTGKTATLPVGIRVTVLSAAALRPVVAGVLSPAGSFARPVSKGPYLVCLRLPGHWTAASGNADVLPGRAGWICQAVSVGTKPATLGFGLTRPVAGAG